MSAAAAVFEDLYLWCILLFNVKYAPDAGVLYGITRQKRASYIASDGTGETGSTDVAAQFCVFACLYNAMSKPPTLPQPHPSSPF